MGRGLALGQVAHAAGAKWPFPGVSPARRPLRLMGRRLACGQVAHAACAKWPFPHAVRSPAKTDVTATEGSAGTRGYHCGLARRSGGDGLIARGTPTSTHWG